MVLSYFGKKPVKHCRGRKVPCSTREACEKLDRAKKNPWTGRYLRSKIRAELKAHCSKRKLAKQAKKRAKMVTLDYWDRNNDQYSVSVAEDFFGEHGANPGRRLGNAGTYWTTYLSRDGKRAVKIRLLKSVSASVKREEGVYKMASNHKIGPRVYHWNYVGGEGFSAVKTLTGRKADFAYLAIAIVERFDQTVNSKVKRLRKYGELYERLEADLDDFYERHGIDNGEWAKDANLLVKLSEDGATVEEMVVGDWGKTTGGKYPLRCDPSE